MRVPLQNALGQFATDAYDAAKQVVSDAVNEALAVLGAGASIGDVIGAAVKTVETETPAVAAALGPVALRLLRPRWSGIATSALA